MLYLRVRRNYSLVSQISHILHNCAFFIFIEIQLIYNTVLCSGIQSDSVVYVCSFLCIHKHTYVQFYGQHPCQGKGACITQKRYKPCHQGHPRQTGHNEVL